MSNASIASYNRAAANLTMKQAMKAAKEPYYVPGPTEAEKKAYAEAMEKKAATSTPATTPKGGRKSRKSKSRRRRSTRRVRQKA